MPEEELPLRSIATEHHPRKTGFKWPDFNLQNVVILLLVLALAAVGFYAFKPEWVRGLPSGKSLTKQEPKQESKSSGYSAVFLVNDQVYFGRLEGANSDSPKLKEVYYLRVQRPLQPPPATESAQPDVQLVKLGNELHGPKDEIQFNRDQILYIEELKTDSRIVKAIEEFKSRNK